MKTTHKNAAIWMLSLAAGAMVATTTSAEIIDHYQPSRLSKAERALDAGNVDRTVALLSDRVSHFNRAASRSRGHSLMCLAHFKKQDFAAAELACHQALSNSGSADRAGHLNNRGVMRLMLGKYEEALVDFEAATSSISQRRAAKHNIELALRELAIQEEAVVLAKQ